MKIEGEIVIPDAKLRYLLTWRSESDKSGLVEKLGFSSDNPDVLRQAILWLIAHNDAVPDGRNQYGDLFAVTGDLVGPTGYRELLTIWIQLTGE